MSTPGRPSNSSIAETLQKEVIDDSSSEPEFRTRIIDHLNKQSAEKREGIFVRLPKSAPGHCFNTAHSWTEDEAKGYLAEGTLPCDLTTLNPDHDTVLMWIFDARGYGGQLPEVHFEEFERVPDFQKHPAICIFDMGVGDFFSLIPSEFLEMVPTGPHKFQFVLSEEEMRQRGVQCEGCGWGKKGKEGGESKPGDEVKKGSEAAEDDKEKEDDEAQEDGETEKDKDMNA